jgi:hypothetical protein
MVLISDGLIPQFATVTTKYNHFVDRAKQAELPDDGILTRTANKD